MLDILTTSSFPLLLNKNGEVLIGISSALSPSILEIIHWLKCFDSCEFFLTSLSQEL